jgi:hypothetical protein
VQLTVLTLHEVPDPRRGVRVGEILGDHRGPAELAGELLQPLLAPGDEDQLRARVARQTPRRRLTDAGRGAGDEGNE